MISAWLIVITITISSAPLRSAPLRPAALAQQRSAVQ